MKFSLGHELELEVATRRFDQYALIVFTVCNFLESKSNQCLQKSMFILRHKHPFYGCNCPKANPHVFFKGFMEKWDKTLKDDTGIYQINLEQINYGNMILYQKTDTIT